MMLLSYPDFMRRVTFEDPRPDANPRGSRRRGGRAAGSSTLGNYPRTMQIAVGRCRRRASDAARRDVFAGAVLAAERGRGGADQCAGDAAAERNPGAARQARSDFERVGDGDGRGNLTAPNHWSQAWTELLAGIAKAGVGDAARRRRGSSGRRDRRARSTLRSRASRCWSWASWRWRRATIARRGSCCSTRA